jgi:Ca-activated chloride channel family protein
MVFAHPWLLLLLLLLPVLAWLKGRRGAPPAFVYSSVQLVRGMQNIHRSKFGGFLGSLRWLALALFIVAAAQPRLAKSTTEVKASGVDIISALDLSGSMEMPDFVVNGRRINRLDMAKIVLRQFIEMRPNDRIGLVVFGGKAYIAGPLTLDHDFLLENVDRMRLHLIEDNTAIGSGLATAVNRLRDLKAKSKIVILATDGQNNSGDVAPLAAAEAAKTLGVKVYTIGIGAPEVAMQMGRPDLLPDEKTLQKIADITGGKYYRADNAEHFQQIYREIDKLEKTEANVKKYTQFTELCAWFAAAGLAVLIIELVLAQTAFRRLP